MELKKKREKVRALSISMRKLVVPVGNFLVFSGITGI